MKRIYFETVKKWAIGVGATGATAIGLIFLYLSMIGAITNETYSADSVCRGTQEDPCYAYINFTANEDIFIYPIDYDPWGRNSPFEFDPNVKSWRLQRSWGTGWRNIPLDKSCTGTWCGLSNSKDERKFSVAFREGKSYQIRIEVLKNNEFESIKWTAFEVIDPVFLGSNYIEVNGKVAYEKVCVPVYEDVKIIDKKTCYNTTIYRDYLPSNTTEKIKYTEIEIKNFDYDCSEITITKQMVDCIYTGEVIEIGEVNKSIKIENYACGYDEKGVVCDEKKDIDGGTGDGNGDGRCDAGETCIRI